MDGRIFEFLEKVSQGPDAVRECAARVGPEEARAAAVLGLRLLAKVGAYEALLDERLLDGLQRALDALPAHIDWEAERAQLTALREVRFPGSTENAPSTYRLVHSPVSEPPGEELELTPGEPAAHSSEVAPG